MAVALYTLDVGHGLCQIILFPGKRAIVIDGGSAATKQIPSEFLERFVDVIVAYIATHNDEDHVGAALHFLTKPKFNRATALHFIYALVDRGSSFSVDLVDYAMRREKAGTIKRFCYAALPDRPLEPLLIHQERSEKCRLDLLYPRMIDNIPSFRSESKRPVLQNRTCACLRLSVGSNSALITGDIDRVGLTEIYNRGFSLKTDVFSVPHHGGLIPGNTESRTWDQLAGDIDPGFALVPSGTDKTKVQPDTIAPFTNRRLSVLCTELTTACHSRPGSFAPGVITAEKGIPQKAGRHDMPGSVACFGSIVSVFDGDRVSHKRILKHRAAVDDLAVRSGSPLCRAASP